MFSARHDSPNLILLPEGTMMLGGDYHIRLAYYVCSYLVMKKYFFCPQQLITIQRFYRHAAFL